MLLNLPPTPRMLAALGIGAVMMFAWVSGVGRGETAQPARPLSGTSEATARLEVSRAATGESFTSDTRESPLMEPQCALHVAIVGVGASVESGLLAKLPGACAAAPIEADLVWDVSARAVFDRFSHRVLDAKAAADVADAMRRVLLERALAEAAVGLPLRVEEEGTASGLLADGGVVMVSVEAPFAGYVQLLNLTPDGRLLRLYPLYEGDRLSPLAAGERLNLGALRPAPPYGRESVWLVVSAAPLPLELERPEETDGEVDAAGYLQWFKQQQEGTLAVRRFGLSTVASNPDRSQ